MAKNWTKILCKVMIVFDDKYMCIFMICFDAQCTGMYGIAVQYIFVTVYIFLTMTILMLHTKHPVTFIIQINLLYWVTKTKKKTVKEMSTQSLQCMQCFLLLKQTCTNTVGLLHCFTHYSNITWVGMYSNNFDKSSIFVFAIKVFLVKI